MGYTNYYKSKETGKFTEEFQSEVEKILKTTEVSLRNAYVCSTGVFFNGDPWKDEDYEDFVLKPDEHKFRFCKTARKPYDEVVKAVLLLAEGEDLLEEFEWDGDQYEDEYEWALKLLEKSGLIHKIKPERRMA